MSIYTTLHISRNKALDAYQEATQKLPTNEELEEWLEAFCLKENFYNCVITNENNEDDYRLDGLTYSKFKELEQEEYTEPFTYSSLKRKIDWDDLHTLIGVDYYCQSDRIEDSEIFDIKQSDIEKYNL